MNQYNLKIVYQAKDDNPIQKLQRIIIKDDIAKFLNTYHCYLIFQIEEAQ